ncbi:MAG: hypothetical protein COU63_02390 [Candidatus Pacebacteria bacterium CG10_big_fil_rev_8_21_14_0_10_36_11]|nr:hypothetical protein [Candidatus Pacearchaeota archaeon]OIP73577.1 MAG: hypothetical protein AUK08_03325 [Candidatus Pacebacteria bacterium CG2_30_36_39]PIR64842.1 MAG: hypothetical protein COU63_02390 [Candidatus Pacebacteria bacterium CG10_big_fil_rev_8_21_14_0_10_36_11]PJC42465.1 MAG: hypothetical protein CO040_04385 [Candidatus Pacebacteria bacterium CG_4_9_14_0_2_um_filter_36_8]
MNSAQEKPEKFLFNSGRVRPIEALTNLQETGKYHYMVPWKVTVLSTNGTRPDEQGYRAMVYTHDQVGKELPISSGSTDIFLSLELTLGAGRKLLADLDRSKEHERVSFKDGSYIELPLSISGDLFRLALRYIAWENDRAGSKELLLAGRPVFMSKMPAAEQENFELALFFAREVEKSPDKFFKRS